MAKMGRPKGPVPRDERRVYLSLPPELYVTVKRLADARGVPAARVVTDILLAAQPTMDAHAAAICTIPADQSAHRVGVRAPETSGVCAPARGASLDR
jgi:hypothetical protein